MQANVDSLDSYFPTLSGPAGEGFCRERRREPHYARQEPRESPRSIEGGCLYGSGPSRPSWGRVARPERIHDRQDVQREGRLPLEHPLSAGLWTMQNPAKNAKK